MVRIPTLLLLMAWAVAANSVLAAPPSAALLEDLARLEQRVVEFSARAPGPSAPRLDQRLRLARCTAPAEIGWFGQQRNAVVVRCMAPAWQIFVPVPAAMQHRGGADAPPAQSAVVVAARALAKGTLLSAADLRVAPARLMRSAASDPDALIGMVTTRQIAAGAPLTASAVAAPLHVRRGDPVIIKSGTPGVMVSIDGIAESNGTTGSRIRVRNLATGKRLQAVVAAPGVVELPGSSTAGAASGQQ